MGCRTLRKLALWVPALLFAVLVCAQTPQPLVMSEQPTIRVTTRLVQVSVVVHDKHGQPITDLTRDDFTVLDGKRPEKIALFAVESSRTLPGPSQSLPADTFANRLEYHQEVPTSVTIILFDGLNTQFMDQAWAREQVLRFLRQLRPEDRVAIYVLGSQLKILHDFTRDARLLIQALGRYKGNESLELQASEPVDSRSAGLTSRLPDGALLLRELNSFFHVTDEPMIEFFTARRVEKTLRALEAIALHAGRFPGRKSLLWVSGSFPFWLGSDSTGLCTSPRCRERRSFSSEVERTARALNDSNLAVYPVDARGLGAGLPSAADPSFRLQMGGSGWSEEHLSTVDTMTILAERTGGQAYYDTNDIFGAIRKAVDDGRVTYALAYYPTHDRWDGRFREIKVEVKRPGLRARYRRGYFALQQGALDVQQRKAVLDEAIWSPLDATSIGLVVKARSEQTATGIVLRLRLLVDPRDLTLWQQGDRWVGNLDILFAQPDAEGLKVKGVSKTLDLRLKQQRYELIMREGLVLTQKVDIVPAAHQLRIVVRDATSGAIGTVTVPLSQFIEKQNGQPSATPKG